MLNRFIFAIIFVVAFLGLISPADAQLQVELMRQGFYDTHVNVDNYPRFSTYIRATFNGTDITLNNTNMLILEDNRSVYPESISQPDAQNWQKVVWVTSLLSKTDTANGQIDKLELFTTYNNNVVYSEAEYRLPSVSIVSFLDMQQNRLNEIYMGTVIPGNTITQTFRIWPQSARTNGNNEVRIPVDSIVLRSGNFTYFDLDGPPFMLTPPILHQAYIIYKPQDMGFKRENLTLYYNGGRKTVLPIIGNSFGIPKSTFLNLIQPNGGEKLTPCKVYEIKWKGSVKGLNTKIEYTTDYGLTWKEIAYVADSSYLWTVPGDIADKVYMRVSQPLQKDKMNNLLVDDIYVSKVAFNSESEYLLALNRGGVIYEWNLNTLLVDNEYSIGNVRYPGETVNAKGIFYFDNDKKFVAAYNRQIFNPADNPDTLAFFNVGSGSPYLQVPAPTIVNEIITDSKKNLLGIVPKYDNKLYILSMSDGSVIRTVDFDYPIATANFSKTADSLVVVLYNNEVIILNTTGFNILKKMNFQDYPQFIKAALTPNNLYIGVGQLLPKKQEFTGNRNFTHLIDIESGLIVRSLGIAASNPVGIDFSPTSNMMISGNEGQPQIAFWDLPQNSFSGSVPGNTALLTDMKVAPNGTIVASASMSDDYLTIKSFTYPETDISDGTFSILRAEVDIDTVLIQPRYIGTDNLLTATRKFCNNGEVPVILDNAQFFFATHFILKSQIQKDTLNPGECLDLEYVYHPVDTGLVRDTLLLYSCSGVFRIPFEGRSLPRNISLFSNPLQFGELCIGEQSRKEFLIARNDDPVPLKINYVTMEDPVSNPFSVVGTIRDSIIQPGGTFSSEFMFNPQKSGLQQFPYLIAHSDLPKYSFKGEISGTGLGTDLQLSHNDLRFIPEILIRKLTIKNLSDNDISIVKANIFPENNFVCLTPLPVSIPAKSEKQLEIQWNGRVDADDSLHLFAEPCVKRTVVVLGPYAAQSYLSIPDVQADANGEASIPIKYTTYSNQLYHGVRAFESEISVNPRMFLPMSVTSAYGTGTITRNDIENDRRLIGFRIEGDFPESGIVGEINGVAGLAETDTSAIRIIPGTLNWGKSVKTTWGDGTLRLINLCGDRRIIQEATVFTSMTLSPNPANDKIILIFESLAEGFGTIDIIDNFGIKIMSISNFHIIKGSNSITIITETLAPGSYTILIRLGGEFITRQIIVVR